MKTLFSCALAICCIGQLVAAPVNAQILRVEGLKTEYQQNPIGIDVRAPRLSWRIQADRRGTMQSAYQIRVATDSGSRRCGFRQIPSTVNLRPYGRPATRSGTRHYWQVRVGQ
jgi:alpha-L-rhamnosidase